LPDCIKATTYLENGDLIIFFFLSEEISVLHNRDLNEYYLFSRNENQLLVTGVLITNCNAVYDMVSTIQIKPAIQLQPFVSCYTLRKFNTTDETMPRPLHAVHECYLTFFLKDKFFNVENEVTKDLRFSSNVCTLFTASIGCAYFKGNFVLFCTQFKANGFSAVFGIPQKILLNAIHPVEDLLGNDVRLLTEQFESSENISEMGMYMNTYLAKKLSQQNHKNHTIRIASISDIISRNKGIVSLDALTHHANMSLRNFERRFVDEVGMPPNLYARVTKFYKALENKMMHPNKRWVDITNENGYFDQAHFIREVKAFSSKTPEELFKFTPPPKESFLIKVE
jgi:AraC-like DNA-binding protein